MHNQGFKELMAYIKAFKLANDIYDVSSRFPKEEKYSLTDQIRRSSRSVCANLAEAYRKRDYPRHYQLKLTDCQGKTVKHQYGLISHSIVNITPKKNIND